MTDNATATTTTSPAPAAAPVAAPAAAPTTLINTPGADTASTTTAVSTASTASTTTTVEGDNASKPVDYQFTLPEGIELDETQLTDFKKQAAEAGLSQDRAQGFLAAHVKALQAATQAPYDLWQTTQTEWQNTVKTDPEIGGKNLDTMLSTVAKAIDQVAGTEATKLRQALDFTGAGNNPDIIRFLYRMSKAVSEGGIVMGGKPAGGSKTAAETLYPTQSQAS
jgi:hypothetical protein